MNQDLCLLFLISYFCLLVTEVLHFLKNQAFVNQLWATICNRFNKTLPDGLAVRGFSDGIFAMMLSTVRYAILFQLF